jgi:hypothetical protein
MASPRSCRWAPPLALLGLALVVAVSPAGAAHEWRAAWAGPQPLWLIERTTRRGKQRARVAAEVVQPFGVSGLRFHALRWRISQAWDLHLGGLGAAAYREWHFGIARRVRIPATADLQFGVRCFASGVAGAVGPPIPAGTLLCEVRAPGLQDLRLAVGAVDLHGGSRPGVPATLLCIRASLLSRSPTLVLEHSVTPAGAGETTLGIAATFGTLRLTHAMRWSVGEGCLTLELRQGSVVAAVGQGWHPDLGWTPRASIAWLGAAPDE